MEEEEELVPQLRFPAGFHFQPTDEELLDVYLRAKIDGREPPLDVFMDVDILDWDPTELVEKRKAYGEGRYFFFTKRTEFPANKGGEARRRKLNNVKASWKATGPLGKIKMERSGTCETIGTKRILTYETKGVHRDRWSMNEYILHGREGLDQWVLCTIQEKLHWDTKSIKRAAGKMAEDTSSKGKMAARGTRRERKTKRQKKEKTDPCQPHKTQQQLQVQQQQETTPNVSSEPPPLLTSDHHALHEEIMPLGGTTGMIQVVVRQEHPYGDQHYLDAPAPQETAYGAPGELPLEPQHQQGYQPCLEEQQQLKFEDQFPVHRQLDQFNTMIFQDHTDREPMLGWWQQQQLGYTDHFPFFPLAGGMEHASGFHHSHQQTLDPFGGDFIPAPDHEVQLPPDPAKPSEQQTSPDSVLCACQHGAVKVTCFLCASGHGAT